MFRIKKIDSYVFKRFITLFIMTFMICIFILLMQFLWRHVVDLVGKGIGMSVLAEFFLYAVFSVVPLALPLAILLASLMTFGNMGENFELTAMKAAGISLFRIMRPLIIFISIICIGAFYFSNNVLPIAQTKLWTLIFSLRQKSPELDIPVGEFYPGIEGYNIYVRNKDKNILKDLMIYDFSGGFNNATVMVADSGKVQITEDKQYLLLTLFNGESFENLKKQHFSSSSTNIPYQRESFGRKEILIEFNSDFNRYDESILQDQHVSKNIKQLGQTIDSVSILIEEKAREQAIELISRNYLGRERMPYSQQIEEISENGKVNLQTYNADSLFLNLDQQKMIRAVDEAIQQAQQKTDLVLYNKMMINQSVVHVSRHEIEWHRKFTLSFACLIFFFIGAPLGAIIRKGGLGMPVVISVIMFIIYYIIDNTGYKMAREGLWDAVQGMWLSSAVLLPVGVFLTYKAAVDATLFRSERYVNIWNKIIKKVRKSEKKY